MSNHSELPWTVEKEYTHSKLMVTDKEYPNGVKQIGILSHTENDHTKTMADRDFLLKAVNNHDKLVEALLDLVCCPAFTGELFEKDKNSHKVWTRAREAVNQAREVTG